MEALDNYRKEALNRIYLKIVDNDPGHDAKPSPLDEFFGQNRDNPKRGYDPITQREYNKMLHEQSEMRERISALEEREAQRKRREDTILGSSIYRAMFSDADLIIPEEYEPRKSEPPVPVAKPEDDNDCCICLDAPTTVAFVPCGHLATCEKCSHVPNCPICRGNVTSTLRIYRQ